MKIIIFTMIIFKKKIKIFNLKIKIWKKIRKIIFFLKVMILISKQTIPIMNKLKFRRQI